MTASMCSLMTHRDPKNWYCAIDRRYRHRWTLMKRDKVTTWWSVFENRTFSTRSIHNWTQSDSYLWYSIGHSTDFKWCLFWPSISACTALRQAKADLHGPPHQFHRILPFISPGILHLSSFGPQKIYTPCGTIQNPQGPTFDSGNR